MIAKHVPRYRHLLLSDFLSKYATDVGVTTLKLWLVNALFLGQDEASSRLSLYLTLSAVSELIAGLFSGAIAERVGVMRAMFAACLLRAGASVGTIGIVWLFASGNISTGFAFHAVTVLVMLTKAADTVYFPAAASAVNRLTESKDLVDVLSLIRFTSLIGGMAGPAVAGFAAARSLYIPVLATELLALLVAALMVLLMRRMHGGGASPAAEAAQATGTEAPGQPNKTAGQPAKASFWREWANGMRTMASIAAYRALVPFAVVEAIAASGLAFGLVFYFSDSLHSPEAYGVYLSVVAFGYAVGYLFAGAASKRLPFWKLLVASQVGVAACLVCMTATSNPFLAIAAGFVLACSQGILNPVFQSIFVEAVDESLVGQAMSVFVSTVGAVGAVSYPAWSRLFSHIDLGSWLGTSELTGGRAITLVVAALHIALALLALADRRVKRISRSS